VSGTKIVIEAKEIVTRFGERTVHDGVSLQIRENEIYGILGESGSGKSVLMKEMIMLLEPNAGEMMVLSVRCALLLHDHCGEYRGSAQGVH